MASIKALTRNKVHFRSGKSTWFSALDAQKVSISGASLGKKITPVQALHATSLPTPLLPYSPTPHTI